MQDGFQNGQGDADDEENSEKNIMGSPEVSKVQQPHHGNISQSGNPIWYLTPTFLRKGYERNSYIRPLQILPYLLSYTKDLCKGIIEVRKILSYLFITLLSLSCPYIPESNTFHTF